jgi:hypothetical protein
MVAVMGMFGIEDGRAYAWGHANPPVTAATAPRPATTTNTTGWILVANARRFDGCAGCVDPLAEKCRD